MTNKHNISRDEIAEAMQNDFGFNRKLCLDIVNDIINKISPTTNVLFATDRIVATEGSLGFSTSEETVGGIQGWYDQAGDTIYLSLQNLEGMLDTNGRPTSKMLELVSHESFHALQRTMGNLKKKGVFTEKEQKKASHKRF